MERFEVVSKPGAAIEVRAMNLTDAERETLSIDVRIPGPNRESLVMNRVWAMPSGDTFSIKPIGSLVRRFIRSSTVSIDPFARNNRWATYTNDLNPETQAERHLFALDFLKELQTEQVRADLIIFDPPYSLRQTKEVYEGVGAKFNHSDSTNAGHWAKEKDICADLLLPNGIFMHFGWHSNGMGKKRGCEVIEILLVAHGRCHNDTICTVERKVEAVCNLELFANQPQDTEGG